MHKIQHYDHDEQIGGISWKQLLRLTSQALERRKLCQILKQKGTQIEMQDFNEAFTQQRNAISAPGLKHGSVMKSNNTHPPPCPPPPFIFLEINISGNLFSIILFNQALQQKTSQVLICLLLIILTSRFLVFCLFFYAIWTRNTIVFSQKNHTIVTVICNVQTYYKNFNFWGEISSVRNEKFLPQWKT